MKLENKIIEAMEACSKGFCLIEKKDVAIEVTWANKAFFKITGLLENEVYGQSFTNILSVFGADNISFLNALKTKEEWQSNLKSEWSGDFHARLNYVNTNLSALWVEKEEDEEALRARLETTLKKVELASIGSERLGFTGPKAFWRSVGAVWTLCSRNEVPVSLGLISITSKELDDQVADEKAKKAIVSTFRRASDVVGRLGMDSYGVFIVGQDIRKSKERFNLLLKILADYGCEGNIGLTSGIPERGSSTQTIKSHGKILLDQSKANNQTGVLESDSFKSNDQMVR